MNKEELLKLAEKHQAKAEEAYQAYQETGVTRYDTARRKNEDMADALIMAANAADEHSAYISIKAQMADFAGRAQSLKYASDESKDSLTEALLRDIVSYGRLKGFIRREE